MYRIYSASTARISLFGFLVNICKLFGSRKNLSLLYKQPSFRPPTDIHGLRLRLIRRTRSISNKSIMREQDDRLDRCDGVVNFCAFLFLNKASTMFLNLLKWIYGDLKFWLNIDFSEVNTVTWEMSKCLHFNNNKKRHNLSK